MTVNNDGTLSTEWSDVSVLLDNQGGIVAVIDTNFVGNARPGSTTDVTIGSLTTGTITINRRTYLNFAPEVVSANNLEIFAGRTLSANDSMMTIHGNVNNLGNFNINTDQVTINGNIINAGLMTISAEGVGGNNSSVLRLEGTTSLTGAGDLRLIGSGTQRDSNDISAELTGATPTGISFLENGSRISGQGIIGFYGNAGDPGGALVLHNLAGGVIDANRTTGTLTLFNNNVTAANPTTNAGTLKASAGGRLDIRSQTVEQSPLGTILADGNGSRVDLWDTVVRGGVITSANGGLIQAANFGTVLDGGSPFGSVTLTTGTVLDVGDRTTLKGAIVNQGTIRQNGYDGYLQIGTEGVTLSGGGEINMGFDRAISGYYDGARLMGVSETATSTLTNVDNNIRGTGYIGKYSYSGFYNDLALVNQAGGRISADVAGYSLYLQGLKSIANAGTLQAVNGATLAIQNITTGDIADDVMTVQNPGGTILADGAGSRVLLSGFSGGNGLGKLTIQGGTLAGTNGGEVQFHNQPNVVLDGSTNQGAVTLQGIFRVDASGTFRGEIRNEGQILFKDNAESTLHIAKESASFTRNGLVSMVGDKIMGELQSVYDSQNNVVLNPAPAVLTNSNATIQGSGFIGTGPGGSFQNRLSLVNGADGVIRANIAPVGFTDNMLTIATGHTVTNNGLIEADGGILKLLDQVTTGGQLRVKNGGAFIVQAGVADDIAFVGSTTEKVRFVSETATPDGLGNQSGASTANYDGVLRGMGVGDAVYTHRLPNNYSSMFLDLNSFGWSMQGNVGVLTYATGQDTATWRIADVERSQIEFVTDGELAGSSYLFGFRRVATTDGDSGNNRMVGTVGKDRLLGLGGNDTLVGSGADDFDIFDGGAGTDTVDYSAYLQGFEQSQTQAGVSISLDSASDAIVYKDDQLNAGPALDLLRSIENIIGTNLADYIASSGAQNNRFDGMDGDDTLNGGAGDDTLDGGIGNDSFIGGAGADIILGGDGFDYLDASPGAGTLGIYADLASDFISDKTGDYDFVTGVEMLIGTNEFITGALSDIMIGDANGNWFYGLGGQDYILGEGGADYIDVGAGAENIALGGEGDDTMIGGADVDFLFGNGGSDSLTGGDGDDWLFTGDFAGAAITGADTAFGGAGNDVIALGDRGGRLALGDGGIGNDTIYGGASANDLIRGGTGSDYVFGNTGADTYRFALGDLVSDDVDTVFAFNAGDRLSFATEYSGEIGVVAGTNAGINGVFLVHTGSTWLAWLPYQSVANVQGGMLIFE
ncbi:MAG: beta strand repeat-containing protein [Beijerinckiaceae bacterium]